MRLLGTVPAETMKSSAVHFFPHDVLYGRLRPYLNKVYRPEFEGLCSAEFIVFPASEYLATKLLQYFLNSFDFVSFASHLNEGDRPRVDFLQLAPYQFPLAPLAEQHRIVAKIEELLTKLDAGVEALRKAQVQLKRYRQSVLKAAVTGELTREWRESTTSCQLVESQQQAGSLLYIEPAEKLLTRILKERRAKWEADQLAKMKAATKSPKNDDWKKKYKEPRKPQGQLPKLPRGWLWVTWEQIGFSQNGRLFPSSEYQPRGIKLLRPGNFHIGGRVVWTSANTRHMPKRWASEFPEFVVKGEELIMNLTAQSLKDEFLGRICITSPNERCLLNQRIARLTPIQASRHYLLWLFKSEVFRRFVDTLNTGSLIQHMFTSQLAAFVLPLPSLDEQHRIVSEVERCLSIADAIERTIEQSLKQAERMRQSVLKRAFEGKLVPQDLNDEPAELLLERIQQERAKREAEKSAMTKRRTTSPKRRTTSC